MDPGSDRRSSGGKIKIHRKLYLHFIITDNSFNMPEQHIFFLDVKFSDKKEKTKESSTFLMSNVAKYFDVNLQKQVTFVG